MTRLYLGVALGHSTTLGDTLGALCLGAALGVLAALFI